MKYVRVHWNTTKYTAAQRFLVEFITSYMMSCQLEVVRSWKLVSMPTTRLA